MQKQIAFFLYTLFKISALVIFSVMSHAQTTLAPQTISIVPNTNNVHYGIATSTTVSYTATNNTDFTLTNIVINASYGIVGTPSTITLQNDLCTGQNINPGDSCTFDILLQGNGTAGTFTLMPQVCGFGCALCFAAVAPNSVFVTVLPNQTAYVANEGTGSGGSISQCNINPNSGLLENCTPTFDDGSFSFTDIIARNDSSMAYLANNDSGNSILIGCPINTDGTLAPIGSCTISSGPIGQTSTGLQLNVANNLLYTSFAQTTGINICSIDTPTFGNCSSAMGLANPFEDVVTGRLAFLLGEVNGLPYEITYMPAPYASTVKTTLSGDDASGCIINELDGTFLVCENANQGSFPMAGIVSLALNPAKTILYISEAHGNIYTCPLTGQFNIYFQSCIVNNDPSFNFGSLINFFITDLFAYIPNSGNNTVSVCPILPNGTFDSCSVVSDPSFNISSSIWIANNPTSLKNRKLP